MTEPELPYDLPDEWPGRIKFWLWPVALSVVFLFCLVSLVIGPQRFAIWFLTASFGAATVGAIVWSRALNRPRRGMRLMERATFTIGSPQPEGGVHVWDFRTFKWQEILTFGVIIFVASALALVFAGIGAFRDATPTDLALIVFGFIPSGYGGIMLMGLARFGVKQEKIRGGFRQREQVLMGRLGISYRIKDVDADVPWEAITDIDATMYTVPIDGPKQVVPFLTIYSTMFDQGFPVQVLGASPLQILSMYRFYWRNPDARAELGTAAAQKRMDDFLVTARKRR